MPRITVKIGGREPLAPAILKGTPLGALGTDAVVRLGQLELAGSAAALRALADACQEAAAMAEEYDADPDAWNERERAERDAADR
jgi:hypothetical protein